jgi:hypothetical protein
MRHFLILSLFVIGCTSQVPAPVPATQRTPDVSIPEPRPKRELNYQPRIRMETSGFSIVSTSLVKWSPDDTLAEIAKPWKNPGSTSFYHGATCQSQSGCGRCW